MLSQFVANCCMDSTQSRLDFEWEEDVDSLHLPLCAREGLKIKFFYSCQSSCESCVNFMNLFKMCKKSNSLTMQLTLCSNDKDLLWMGGNF